MSAPLRPLIPADDVGQQEAPTTKRNKTVADNEHGNTFIRMFD